MSTVRFCPSPPPFARLDNERASGGKPAFAPCPGEDIEAAGAGTKIVVDQTQADGTTRHWEVTANYDGKDNPITGNNPDADMLARTRITATTIKTVSKKGGKVTTTQTSQVSADGKTRTVTTTGVNGAGQKVNNVAVYDRQ